VAARGTSAIAPCLAFSHPFSRSSSFVLSIKNSTSAVVLSWASDAMPANHANQPVTSFCLLAVSSAPLFQAFEAIAAAQFKARMPRGRVPLKHLEGHCARATVKEN